METVTLTNLDILTLSRAIAEVGHVVAPVRFTYALGRTRRAIAPVVESIDQAQQAQHAKYLALAQEHAVRDDAGEPVQGADADGRTGYQIDPARKAAFSAAVQALNDELAALLHETVEVQLHMVPLDAVPDLTGAQVDALLPMIADG